MGCVGLIVAMRTRSVQVTVNSWLLFMPLAFLTSAFMPRDLLTGWFQVAVGLNPIEYIMVAVRAVIIEGWVWDSILPGIWVLLATTLVLVGGGNVRIPAGDELKSRPRQHEENPRSRPSDVGDYRQ